MLNIRDDACLLFDRTIAGEGVCGWCWVTGLKSLVSFRLWHQLTLQVLDFVQDPCFAQGDGLIKVSDLPCCVTVFKYAEVLLKIKGGFLSYIYIYISLLSNHFMSGTILGLRRDVWGGDKSD